MTTLLNNIYKNVIEMIQENNMPFFIGGSRRFGYDNRYSDYDIFINEIDPLFRNLLVDNGFTYQKNSEYKFNNHFRLSIGNNHIDIILLDSKSFNQLYAEHNLIENFLNENQNITRFIKMMKFFNKELSGKFIYRSILYIIKNNQYIS